MEPVTHVLTGACLARAGFNRRAAYATLTMAIAAEMPDIDTVWSWRGPIEGFAHHRGITHTFLGLPFEAALLVGAMWGFHRWRMARAAGNEFGSRSMRKTPKAPVNWWALYGCALVGLLSHLLLDYTNNYGLRPFYPFNPHWYAASIAFIFDPLIFALLVFALVLPSIFGLVSSEVGAKSQPFRGRGLAIVALLGITAWLGFRAVEHGEAVQLAMEQTYERQQVPGDVANPGGAAATGGASAASADTELAQPPSQLLPALRALASPEPIDPFRWAVAIDYGPLYQLANVDVRNGSVTPSEVTYPKLVPDEVVRAAEASPVGRVYLDWSSMPIVSEEQPIVDNAGVEMRRVLMRDPRFMGDVSWLRLSGSTPLTAVVTVEDGDAILRQTMDGRREPAGHGPVYESQWTLPWFRAGASDAAEVHPLPKPVPAVPKHIAVMPKIELPDDETPAPSTAVSRPAARAAEVPTPVAKPTPATAVAAPPPATPKVEVPHVAVTPRATGLEPTRPRRVKVPVPATDEPSAVPPLAKEPPHPIVLPQ